MGDYVYLTIGMKNKQISFHETYDRARASKGTVRKVERRDKYEILKIIRNSIGYPTIAELDRWQMPDWIKKWMIKSINKTILITYVDNQIYYKFQGDLFVNIINKRLYPYDIEVYIYNLLLHLAEFHDIETLMVYSDLIDLVRINRMRYDPENKRNLMIKVISYDSLEDKMEGN